MTSTPKEVREPALDLLKGTGATIRDVLARFGGKKAEIDPEALEAAVIEALAKAKPEEADAAEDESPS